MKKFATLAMLLTVITIVASPEPQIGGVLQHAGAYEISVIYSEPVDIGTMTDPENYTIAPGSIATLRLCATNQGVVLTVNGLTAGIQGTLIISNVQDPAGNVLPTASLDFSATDWQWVNVGANELSFPYDAIGFPTNGFDLFSGGDQQRDEYDDATFAAERIQGDFEVKVRVDEVDPAGAGTKAGIMIREQLDEGKPRPVDPDDPAQAFSRYVELAISAPADALGDATVFGHQIWQREVSPSLETLSLTVTNDAAPAFTNAWLRIIRTNEQFTMWRGTDGQHWQQIGAAAFNPPLSTNVYVGLAFSPQNDDIPPASDLRNSFVAKFRDYSLTPIVSSNLRIEMVGDHAEVTWSSGWTLETAPNVTDDWTTASSQQNPFRVDFTEPKRFFRARK